MSLGEFNDDYNNRYLDILSYFLNISNKHLKAYIPGTTRSQIIQGHYHLRDVPLGKLRPSQINVGLLRRLIQPFLV